MKRNIGYSAIKKKQTETASFSAVGRQLEDTKGAKAKETLSTFKAALQTFAEKHRDRINSDPEFRMHFHTMCQSVGVDPLASNKGFWADLLGFGDFYFELGVHIIQICMQTRPRNGGIISLSELQSLIKANPGCRGRASVSGEDIKRAAEKLLVLGHGFKIMNIAGKPFVVSVPLEVSRDHELILTLAQEGDGSVSFDELAALQWSRERFELTITPMIRDGLVWIDDHEGSRRYFFQSIWRAQSTFR
jgi:ESCRT-II complex subunit VPS22